MPLALFFTGRAKKPHVTSNGLFATYQWRNPATDSPSIFLPHDWIFSQLPSTEYQWLLQSTQHENKPVNFTSDLFPNKLDSSY